MIAALALTLTLLNAAGATTVAAAAAKGSVSVNFKIEARTPGTKTWAVKGTYPTEAAARAEAARLFNAGSDVRLTKSESVTWLRTEPSDDPRRIPTGDLVDGVSVVSLARAQEVSRALATRGDIAFRYPTDGCYARAHLMGLQLMSMGLRPGKVWAFDDAAFKGSATRMVAVTKDHPNGFVSWRYHVAPALKIRRSDGQVVTAVLDPSLHDRPVSVSVWQKRMSPARGGFKPRTDVTAWGMAPRDPEGRPMAGTGYGPGGDPPGDLTRAARATMVLYKPHEGTAWTPPRPAVAARGANDPSAVPLKEFTDKHLLDLP